MAVMTEELLASVERLPIATAGELRMWNFSVRGVDLETLPTDHWITTTWAFGYQVAADFLKEMGMDKAAIAEALLLNTPLEGDIPLKTRWRLYDVNRIRIALLLRYPYQPHWQRHWLATSQSELSGQVPLVVMRTRGSGAVRALLEELLGV